MVVLSVIDIVLLIAGLAFYLFVVGGQLTRIAGNLEECFEIAGQVVGNAQPIIPGVEHINRTGGVVAGALPLLYGMAEGIVSGVTPAPAEPVVGLQPGRLPAAAARACTTVWATSLLVATPEPTPRPGPRGAGRLGQVDRFRRSTRSSKKPGQLRGEKYGDWDLLRVPSGYRDWYHI